MSRRREAADLARALLLSTQEATTIAHLSPHTLSSNTGTPDSKDMELQPIGRPASSSAISVPSSLVPDPNNWGQPPVVRTLAEDQAHHPGATGLPPPRTSDPILTATTPSGGMASRVIDLTAGLSSDISLNTPSRAPMITSLSVITSAGKHSSPPVTQSASIAASSKAPYSSPDMLIPSSRISHNNISSGSSRRVLFSPTQTSSRLDGESGTPPQTKTIITYGKKQDSPIVEGLQTAGPSKQTSPLKAADPPFVPVPATDRLPLSDDEDEEAPEPVEESRGGVQTPRTSLEILLPPRSMNVVKETPIRTNARTESPDPLDQNIQRRTSIETFPLDRIVTPRAIVGPSSATSDLQSRTSKSPITETQRTNRSMGPTRMSKRQQAQKEQEEAEKEAKREARRIRKEKERLEEEKEDAAARSMRKCPSKADEHAAKSILALDGPPNRSEPSRGTDRLARNKRSEKPAAEVIVLDETMPESLGGGPEPAVEPVVLPKQGTGEQPKNRSRCSKRKRAEKEEDAKEDEWYGSETDDMQPKQKKAVEPKTKESKKKQVSKSTVVAVEESSSYTEAPAEKVDASLPAAASENEDDEENDGQRKDQLPPITPIAEKAPSISPTKPPAMSTASPRSASRSPLKAIPNGLSTPRGTAHQPSPGPSTGPKGYQWKTQRQDLASVLSKFGGARQSGMSRRNKIVSLHTKIGPPVKALPPPPPKPSKKKKEDSEEEDSEAEMESDGEGGVRKKVKERGMEWFMVED